MHGPGDVRFFDRVARLYDRFAPPTDPEPIWAGLARADRPVERVLDLAGGTGRAARAIAAPVGTARTPETVVVDASRRMLTHAADRGTTAVQGDAGRLPVRDAATDAVVVLDALHHLPDQAAALAEAARVLRPGGVLVIREYDPGTLRGRALVAAERAVGFDSTFWGPDAWAAAVDDAGLVPTVLDRGFAFTVVGKKRESH
ncbi:class I SAM-dependent methyltransferase [Haloplanus aerogenes]|uniref:Demethylmenaquinone methyltransferase/2-methoxy-6-polyprenyl-1,4-benzoquinol methylase n=1 Tax=Haloplanus aerogenes TaxID=660522 RepID=A0A3M0DF94_9EURY|nr:methyltransferase domain-containing protein [Haloplanus aerogenes]AZH26436.1 methyltransferase domain-containing protein [Haloplanus aerogenes]RMB18099.1 demethylmenaquinone methyltransferase/2-methoxy-6-polyprenyl-1,4-benzoquinol methylase [Haloplanus aerogenes]